MIRLTPKQAAAMMTGKRPGRKRQPTEKEVQTAITDWLRARGAFVIRINSGAMAGTYKGRRRFVKFNDQPGCADLLAVWPHGWHDPKAGIFLAVEVKRPGPDRTPLKRRLQQEAFRAEVIKRGGIACVVSSVEALAEVLEGQA